MQYPEYPNLRYVHGNLLDSYRDGITIIGHQCNCRYAWKGGIHRQIGEQWRRVILHYLAGIWNLGDMRIYDTTEPNFRIAYLAGQDDYGNSAKTGRVYTQMWALEAAMHKLAAALRKDDRLAFPLIGAGLAGGDWNDIAAMISRVFADRTVTIYIYP